MWGKPVFGIDQAESQANNKQASGIVEKIQSFNWLRKQKHKTSV